MAAVKKSVAIHPILDKIVRRFWASLITAGYDANYSTVLNMLSFAGAWALIQLSENDELWKLIKSFLQDTKILEDLKLAEFETEIMNIISKRLIEKELSKVEI